MANVKISDLPAATADALTDVYVLNQSGTTKRSTLQLLIDLIEATGLTFTTGQNFTDITASGNTLSNGVKLNALPAGYRNGTIDASVASNAITITYETQASATPSATDPVTMTHRSATITDGAITNRNQTAALSLVIPSGATLGCASSEVVRIHVVGILNADAAMELAVFTGAVGTSTSIQRFDPTALQSTTAIGAGSDSAQTLYSTTARTSQPIVYLGYIEATSGATAGEWASRDKIVNWEPGVPMPGDVVAINRSVSGAVATGTTAQNQDDTEFEITEGTQFMSLAHTAKSIMNWLEIMHIGYYSEPDVSISHLTGALFLDSTTNAYAVGWTGPNLGSGTTPMPCELIIKHSMKALSASEITYRIRAGISNTSTVTFNGAAGGRYFAGKFTSTLEIKEIHS